MLKPRHALLVMLLASILIACDPEPFQPNLPDPPPGEEQPIPDTPEEETPEPDEPGDDPQAPEPPRDEDETEGSVHGLAVTITGLPGELEGSITITAQDGTRIPHTSDMSDLEDGTYTITATPVSYHGNDFDPLPLLQHVEIREGESLPVTVRYAPHRAYSQAALEFVNEYRNAAGLKSVTLDAEEGLPHWLHSRYMAVNETLAHDEDPALPYYSEAGRTAGLSSNVHYSWSTYHHPAWDDPAYNVEMLMPAPFHAFSFLDPLAESLRMGVYTRYGNCPAWDRHNPCTPELNTVHAATMQFTRTQAQAWPESMIVRFPADGQTTSLLAHTPEWPSPLTACEFSAMPAGLPIFVMHGRNNLPAVTDAELTLNGEPINSCHFTSSSYTNPDASDETLARNIMDAYGAVIIVPEKPLQPGSTYTVNITYQNTSDSWEFHTATTASPTFAPQSISY